MTTLLVALAFLTRLPVPVPRGAGQTAFRRAVPWFPVAGLAVGAPVAGLAWLGGLIDPWLGGLAGLAGWVWVTGALHLDGLGDIADAAGAAHGDRERLIPVLHDPHVGSFAVVAIGLQLAAKLVLLRLAVVEQAWLALLLVPVAARIGILVWQRWLAPLGSGFGATLAGTVRLPHLAGWAAMLAGLAVLVPALTATPLLFAGWWWWLRRRLGGINGDGHGAGIELTETGLLLVLACLA